MNEEELKAKAEELTAKEGDLATRENDLNTKEESLNARENELAKREADASSIAQTLKEEFNKKLEAQKEEYETRLHERDAVIRQLASGDNPAMDENSPFAEINKRRLLQKSA